MKGRDCPGCGSGQPDRAGRGCHKQVLKPVAGYRMPPGGQARIYVVVKALRPGSWVIPRQVVTYTQDGATHQHVFPIRYWDR